MALLLVEIVALTLRFDTETLTGIRGAWANWLGQVHLVARLGITVAAALLLLGGLRLGDQLARAGETHPAWVWLMVHLGMFAGFAWLTALVMEERLRSSPDPARWVVSWVLVGLGTLVSWGLTLQPAGVWLRAGRQNRGVLLAGGAVGVVALGAGLITDQFWRPLGWATFWAARGLLGVLCRNTEVVSRPAELALGTGGFSVAIAPGCSGYEGIGLIWVFTGAYLVLFRRHLRFPQALWLLPMGTVLIWLANVIRIVALIVVGTWVSPAVARGGFHSQAGWILFNAVALGLVVLSQHLRLFDAADVESWPGPANVPDASPIAPYLAPLAATLAIAMITGAFSGSTGFDAWYPLRVLGAAGVLGWFRREYGGERWGWTWASIAVGVGVFIVWMALEPSPPQRVGLGEADADSGTVAGLRTLAPAWAAVWLGFRVLGAVVTVPLVEELAFRGYVFRRLSGTDPEGLERFPWWPLVASSVLFGALHGRWLAGTLAGMGYALAFHRRGRMGDAVAAHATTNALIAAVVLSTQDWSLWG